VLEQALTAPNDTVISAFKTKGVGHLNCVDLKNMTEKASHRCQRYDDSGRWSCQSQPIASNA